MALTKYSYILSGLLALLLFSCSHPLPWPESPLYSLEIPQADDAYPIDRDAAIQRIVGHYAHFDVVAYEDNSTKTPMRTFIISYGFTDFFEEDGKLIQIDDFHFAEYQLNQRGVTTSFNSDAVQSIPSRRQEVELYFEDGLWKIYRPESPVLLGISGDFSQPLSQNPYDPLIFDADGDGNPGVTVDIRIARFIRGEIYIIRREIYRDYLTLFNDGRLIGHVQDLSEQFVIDANMKILRQPSNNKQVYDPGLNPIILIPIDEDIDTPAELEELIPQLFPPPPTF